MKDSTGEVLQTCSPLLKGDVGSFYRVPPHQRAGTGPLFVVPAVVHISSYAIPLRKNLHKHTPEHEHARARRCFLRPAAASALPSVAASDSVCRTWGRSTPGDSLAVRKSCLLFIFTVRRSPTLGHSHPCNTSKNLYLPALAAFPTASVSLPRPAPTGLLECRAMQIYT